MSGYFGLSAGTETWYNLPSQVILAGRFQNNQGAGNITSIGVLLDDASPAGSVRLAIYADNGSGSAPAALLRDCGVKTLVNGWNDITGFSIPCVDGYYWLAAVFESENDVVWSDTDYIAYSFDYGFAPFLDPWPGVDTTTGQVVMRAYVETGAPPPVNYNLNISIEGSGTTTPAVGSYTYPEGTVVNVTATPGANFMFAEWRENGVLLSTSPTISVTMNSDRNIVATFVPTQLPPFYTLTISTNGDNGITNPLPGSYNFQAGAIVRVTATPNGGYGFASWQENGVDISLDPVIDVVVDRDRNIMAMFYPEGPPPISFVLNLEVNGPGTTIPVPSAYYLESGSYYDLTAVPDAGAIFLGWSEGGITFSYDLSISILMSGDRTIVANFSGGPVMPNAITIGAMDLTPSYESIHVVARYTGDDNRNAQAQLRWRRQGTTTWKNGMVMCNDTRALIYEYNQSPPSRTNPHINQFRGVILGLTPNAAYEVRVEFSDADGIVGTNPSGTVTTLNDNPPSTGNTYYVATTGNDSNAGTSAAPWRTVAKGVSSAQAGDTVRIRAGSYNEQLTMPRSGAINNYITFMADDPLNMPRIYRASPTNRGVFYLSGRSYLRFLNLNVEPSGDGASAFFITGASTGNIIKGCRLICPANSNWWTGAIILNATPVNTLIDNNIITCALTARGGDGPFGVLTYKVGSGTCIRDNDITGGYEDAIGSGGNFQENDGPYLNSTIMRNFIRGYMDDCIEAEGGGINCAIYDNELISLSGNMCFGLAPVIVGPMYIIHNTGVINEFYAAATVKLGSDSYGYIFFYHNTFTQLYATNNMEVIATYGSTSVSRNQVYRNNIILNLNGRCVANWDSVAGMDWDYNLIWSPSSSQRQPITWPPAGDIAYSTWRANYGQEAHGLWAEPLFINRSGYDFHLQNNSPGIDAGIIIAGINDADSPWPYLGSGPDMGAYETGAVVNPTLAVAITGTGTTTPAPGSYQYAPGSVINLQATPGTGWRFDHWEGPVANPTSASTTVTLTVNTTVTAVFVQIINYNLTIAVTGSGSTTPAAGVYTYEQGIIVDLAAVPASGWMFTEWREGATVLGTTSQISVQMTGNRSITAVFSQIPIPPGEHSLTISVVGNGSTSPAPGVYTYDEGAAQAVQAIPASGWLFVEWVEGINRYTQNPINLIMDADRSLTAVFQEIITPPVQYTLTMQAASGSGITSPGAGAYQYEAGSVVQIAAIPNAGWEFVEWRQDGVQLSTNQVTTVTMNSNRSIQALFAPIVIPPDQYSLTISVVGSGSTSPAPDSYLHNAGASVSVQALPTQVGVAFVEWVEGTNYYSQNPINLVMDRDRSITAVFEEVVVPPIERTLTMQPSTGGDTVPGAGAHVYDENTIVQLAAVADSGYQFISWEESGSVISTYPITSIVMSADRIIKANFEEIVVPPGQNSLTLSQVGEGTITPGPGSYLYNEGATVNVQAVASSGWQFKGWLEGMNFYLQNPIAVIMNIDRSLTAIFESVVTPPVQHELSIVAGTGGYTVPGVGSYTYNEGAVVPVAAIPDAGYRFVEWKENGETISTEQAISVLMNSDRSIEAVFDEIIVPPEEYSLTVSVRGYGTTEPAPGGYTYPAGTVVALTAIASEEYQFSHWEGAASGNNPSTSVVLDGNMSVTAVFVEVPPVISAGIPMLVAAGVAVTGIIASIMSRRKR